MACCCYYGMPHDVSRLALQPGSHEQYLQECCRCRGSRGSGKVWHLCVSEGGAGGAMPSWQRRDSAGTGGASAPDALCGACGGNQKRCNLEVGTI